MSKLANGRSANGADEQMQDRDALTALSPGVQLWLIPPLDRSAWSRRIDWYLGFQIRRIAPRKRFDFGPDLRQLMDAYESEMPRIPNLEQPPLMIASALQLPNHQTVVVPETADLKAWALACHRVWKGLSAPAARVFLPPGFTREAFEKAWPGDSGHSDLEIVSAQPPV